MLKLKVISPEKVIYDVDVESVKVPGTLGSFEVLSNHAPIISSLVKGIVEYVTKDGSRTVDIDGGFVEVENNEVNLCVELQQ